MLEKKSDETKEDFCTACLAAPLAAIGVGVGATGAGSHKKKKSIMLWVGLGITILAILIAVYFLWIKKCDKCR